MQVEQILWTKNNGWDKAPALAEAGLVIYFGGKDVLNEGTHYQELKKFYPKAQILGGSTGGEISGAEVLDDSITVAAITFSKTTLQVASTQVKNAEDSFKAGQTLANELNKSDLKNIFILSDGTNVNGSDLVRGLYDVLDEKIIVTGGLAGDGANFKHTLVGLNAPPADKVIAAIGFYGNALQVQYGSVGGWSKFGPERKITKSKDNILYELDGKPALDLYKQYLGDDANKLPGSALLFPLSIRPMQESEHDIVRTIVGVDEKEKTMIYAGDIPTGHIAQLMRGDFDLLIDGATEAAKLAQGEQTGQSLAILVSCIGRKLLLGQSISDETEAVADVFNHKIPMIGFYSYGEICHQQFTGKCSLHNQTMTVTVFHEA